MPNPSPDENQPEQDSKSTRLAQDITDLQKEIRQDFDQRIFDLTTIMARFKSLMINDVRSQSQQSTAPNMQTPADRHKDSQQLQSERTRQIPILTRKVPLRPIDPAPEKQVIRPVRQHARFETGLYRLNSQLQRFRLELDQELEFRQQPLHVHFRQPSELAKTLQQLSLNNDKDDDASHSG